MFFLKKKKKEDLSDQTAVYKERQSPRWGKPRFELNTGIAINGFEGEGKLGNVSATGCSMESVTYVALMPDKMYNIRIIPGGNDAIEPFDISLKLSWTKSSETLFQAGFYLDEDGDGSKLNRYVEYLRGRGLLPDYGTTGPDRN